MFLLQFSYMLYYIKFLVLPLQFSYFQVKSESSLKEEAILKKNKKWATDQ